MFARSLYQKSVDKLVAEELQKIHMREKILNDAKSIYHKQTTQSRIDSLINNESND